MTRQAAPVESACIHCVAARRRPVIDRHSAMKELKKPKCTVAERTKREAARIETLNAAVQWCKDNDSSAGKCLKLPQFKHLVKKTVQRRINCNQWLEARSWKGHVPTCSDRWGGSRLRALAEGSQRRVPRQGPRLSGDAYQVGAQAPRQAPQGERSPVSSQSPFPAHQLF
jgi:hypothetical protein